MRNRRYRRWGGGHVGLEVVCVSRGVPEKGPGAEMSRGGPRSPTKGEVVSPARAHWRGCREEWVPLGSGGSGRLALLAGDTRVGEKQRKG